VIRLRTRSGVDAEMFADRLIARAADPVRVGNTLHRVRIHVGLATGTDNDNGPSMLNRAFTALDTAYGAEGRNWSAVPIS
jgi:GGDEF domain-containing protein